MKIGREIDQTKTESPACGTLKNILHTEKFGIVSFDNIGITGKHYHLKMEEAYFLLSGNITVEVKETKSRTKRRLKLSKGDVLLLQPGDVHQIVKVSKSNRLLVFCVPDWREDDELAVK